MKINTNPVIDVILKKQVSEGNGTHGSAGGLFSGIFAPYFEVKSVNNLLFNKFKCKRFGKPVIKREQYNSCNNGKPNNRFPFFLFIRPEG